MDDSRIVTYADVVEFYANKTLMQKQTKCYLERIKEDDLSDKPTPSNYLGLAEAF